MGENVTHFSHPLHPLGKSSAPESFTCDACMMEGWGHMYWCESCDFKLHCLCATCPLTLAFFLHPEHPIILVNLKGHIGAGIVVTCDVCKGEVPGVSCSYRCAVCDFDVHPQCAMLPPTVRDDVHPDHILTFIESKRRPCTQCGIACTHGRYRCDLCDVDFHSKCLQRSATGGVIT